MPEIVSPTLGTFCWFELGTTDQAAARAFYTSLFGWTGADMPTGPSDVYTVLKLGGKDVGGLYALNAEMRAHGVPPHWMVYVAVKDADASAGKAKELGGKTMADPFDVMDLGRMCVVSDPQGAMFAIWQAKKSHGVHVFNEPGAPSWGELATKDIEAAKKFYGGLFGWEGHTGAGDGMTYTEWKLPDVKQFGGMIQIAPEWGPVPPHWLTYFRVNDCDAAVAEAKRLGASVKSGPMEIAHVGKFAVLSDPQGAVFAIIKLAEHH